MNEKWDLRFLQMAQMVASWSKDTTKVGCVIVDDNKIVKAIGYNGIPRNLDDTMSARLQRPAKYLYFSHAEINALDNYSRNDVDNCTIYVTHFPCATCARSLIQTGIKRVVYIESELADFDARWKDDHDAASSMFEELGIVVHSYSNLQIQQ